MATKKTEAETQSLLDYFADLPDPRRDNKNREHKLIDILAISILATICGAEFFTDMETFGKSKEEFLKTFLELPAGIPTHDTFARVFARLDTKEFERRFMDWVETIRTATTGEVIAIDGKTARRSHDRSKDKEAIHLVSAWATRNRLTLGQVKVDEKSNEITAVPELLRLLYIKDCIVTVDALNTQKTIAQEIREQGADYLLALKENHPNLLAEVEGIFEAECEQQTDNTTGFSETVESHHGRKETRRVWSVAAPDWLRNGEQWRDLQSLILVEARREIKDQVSTEERFYISSLAPDAKRAAEVVRSHWGVENSLHWVLDVAFREDDSRVRVGNAAENLALVRKITHNLLQHEKTLKRGIKTKRLKAGWDHSYLLTVLNVKPSTS